VDCLKTGAQLASNFADAVASVQSRPETGFLALDKKPVSVDGKSRWSADASPPLQVLKQAEAGLHLHSGSQILKYRVLPASAFPLPGRSSGAKSPVSCPPRERLHAVKTVAVTEKILSHALREERDGA